MYFWHCLNEDSLTYFWIVYCKFQIWQHNIELEQHVDRCYEN